MILNQHSFSWKDADVTYERNMNVLQQVQPELFNEIRDFSKAEQFFLIRDHDQGLLNLSSKTSDFHFYSGSPRFDAAREINRLSLKNARLAVFLGLGLG